MNISLIGPPGAGKGTQSRLLVKSLSVPEISTSEILRLEVSEGTRLGRKAEGYMSKGQFVPDSLMRQIIEANMAKHAWEKGFVFVGYPRTVQQARDLLHLLRSASDRMDIVIHLKTDSARLLERMLGRRICPNCGERYQLQHRPPARSGVCDACGSALIRREDDDPEIIEYKLAAFHKELEPLLRYYGSERVEIVEIEAGGSVEEVRSTIMAAATSHTTS